MVLESIFSRIWARIVDVFSDPKSQNLTARLPLQGKGKNPWDPSMHFKFHPPTTGVKYKFRLVKFQLVDRRPGWRCWYFVAGTPGVRWTAGTYSHYPFRNLERKMIWPKPPWLCSMLIFRGVYLLTSGFCWRDFWGYLGSWYSRLSCWCNAHCGRLYLATVQYCTGYLCTMRKCCHAWWKKWMSNCTCIAASVQDPWTYIFPIRFTCKMSNEKDSVL